MTRILCRAVLVLLCLACAMPGPAPASAAEGSARANDLTIVLVPYGWLTVLSGKIDTKD